MTIVHPRFLSDILKAEQNSFGVIRVAMALAVLVSHSYYFVTGAPAAEPLHAWTGHSLGEHAVQVFFFLSGILVTESLLRSRNAVDFAIGRAVRIFPGLVVCVFLTVLVLGPAVSTMSTAAYFSDATVASYIVKTVLLISGAASLPGVFEQLPAAGLFNMSLWTLKYEILCYAALAILGFALLRQPKTREFTTFALALVIFTIFLRAPSLVEPYSVVDNLRYFALYFGVGTLAALHKDKLTIDWKATGILGLAYFWLQGTPWAELSCALFIGSLTLLAATWTFGPLRKLANKQDISFGIYIYAAPIQQAVFQAYPTLDPLSLAATSLTPVVILAYCSWIWVEKPSLSRRSMAVGWAYLLSHAILSRSGHVQTQHSHL